MFKRHVPFALAFAVTLTCTVLAFQAKEQSDPPKPFTGKVIGVTDGDTITVLVEKTPYKIRLAGIDAPESGQPFGTAAKKALSEKIFDKEVKIEWKERDKYKRIIGEVYIGERRICLEMVQEGVAWHYKQYSKDADLAKAEKEAKEAKKGLWADEKPVSPWDWRKKKGLPEEKGDGTVTVFVTNTGTKYHREGCRYLDKSMTPIPLKDAIGKYEPCKVCNPPTKVEEKEEKKDTAKEEKK